LSRKLNAMVGVSVFVLAAIGVVLFPRIVARFLKPHGETYQRYSSTGISAGYAGPAIEVLPRVEVGVPRSLRVTETKQLSIVISKYWLGHSDAFPGSGDGASGVSDQSPYIDNRVAKSYTVDLKVVDDAGVVCVLPEEKAFGKDVLTLESIHWYCTIHPKQPGDYSILISGLPAAKDVGSFTVSDVSGDGLVGKPREYERLADGTLDVPVTVLTTQGVTAREWAWLQCIGACIGVLGTLLGYPFLKSKFDRSPSDPSGSPHNTLWPQDNSVESLKSTLDRISRMNVRLIRALAPSGQGGIYVNELAAELGISRQDALSRAVNLQTAGLVEILEYTDKCIRLNEKVTKLLGDKTADFITSYLS
jgi:hypothetical protein